MTRNKARNKKGSQAKKSKIKLKHKMNPTKELTQNSNNTNSNRCSILKEHNEEKILMLN